MADTTKKTALVDRNGAMLLPLPPPLPRDPSDPRRHGVIEVRHHPGPPAVYHLKIAGQLWALVEWSPPAGAGASRTASGCASLMSSTSIART
jgi:hypothetical protein